MGRTRGLDAAGEAAALGSTTDQPGGEYGPRGAAPNDAPSDAESIIDLGGGRWMSARSSSSSLLVATLAAVPTPVVGFVQRASIAAVIVAGNRRPRPPPNPPPKPAPVVAVSAAIVPVSAAIVPVSAAIVPVSAACRVRRDRSLCPSRLLLLLLLLLLLPLGGGGG